MHLQAAELRLKVLADAVEELLAGRPPSPEGVRALVLLACSARPGVLGELQDRIIVRDLAAMPPGTSHRQACLLVARKLPGLRPETIRRRLGFLPVHS